MSRELGLEMRAGAVRYATAGDRASKTTLRAQVLSLMDKLALDAAKPVSTRRVFATELSSGSVLGGAIVMHLDLMFRAATTVDEVLFTATRGIVRVAFHDELPEFPVGVALALPSAGLLSTRAELFSQTPPPEAVDRLSLYALATSPARLGAGAMLVRALASDCRQQPGSPGMVAFSPLTGMRARVIRLVDDARAWAECTAQDPAIDGDELRKQLLALLAHEIMPATLDEPVATWLANEARAFASSPAYVVGNFHRAMGATLVGVADRADAADIDALWARAHFDYSGTPAAP